MANSKISEVQDPLEPMNLQILCLYIVQKLGQGTLDQIQKSLADKVLVFVHVNMLKTALDALRKRNFISLNDGRDEEGNIHRLYGIKDLRFAHPPEVCQYADLLPKLL